jgi:hypothetical protein
MIRFLVTGHFLAVIGVLGNKGGAPEGSFGPNLGHPVNKEAFTLLLFADISERTAYNSVFSNIRVLKLEATPGDQGAPTVLC